MHDVHILCMEALHEKIFRLYFCFCFIKLCSECKFFAWFGKIIDSSVYTTCMYVFIKSTYLIFERYYTSKYK